MLQLTFNPGLTLTGFRTTRPRLEGYYLQRLPCQKTELRSNDLRIQIFVLGKP